ncbi:hypothetical protein [Streptomyces sp. NPDC088730]
MLSLLHEAGAQFLGAALFAGAGAALAAWRRRRTSRHQNIDQSGE